jgi:hypothetical protein
MKYYDSIWGKEGVQCGRLRIGNLIVKSAFAKPNSPVKPAMPGNI